MGQTGGGYVAGATGVVAWLSPEHRIHAARGPASPKIFHSPKGGTPRQRGPAFTPSSPWPRSAPATAALHRDRDWSAGVRPKFRAGVGLSACEGPWRRPTETLTRLRLVRMDSPPQEVAAEVGRRARTVSSSPSRMWDRVQQAGMFPSWRAAADLLLRQTHRQSVMIPGRGIPHQLNIMCIIGTSRKGWEEPRSDVSRACHHAVCQLCHPSCRLRFESRAGVARPVLQDPVVMVGESAHQVNRHSPGSSFRPNDH